MISQPGIKTHLSFLIDQAWEKTAEKFNSIGATVHVDDRLPAHVHSGEKQKLKL